MYRDRRQYTIIRLRNQIWRERQLFFLVLVVLLGFIFYQRWAAGFYALKVKGVAVVWAKSRKDAEELLQMVKRSEGGTISPNVKTRFAEKVEIRRERFSGEEIPDLQEGVAKLLPHLSLLVTGPAVLVDGKAVVGVPSREFGELVLKEVKRRLGPVGAGGQLVEEKFKQNVEMKEAEVPVGMYREDTEQAVEMLAGKEGSRGTGMLTLVTVMKELQRGATGEETVPGSMVEVTYENGKETKRKPVE